MSLYFNLYTLFLLFFCKREHEKSTLDFGFTYNVINLKIQWLKNFNDSTKTVKIVKYGLVSGDMLASSNIIYI